MFILHFCSGRKYSYSRKDLANRVYASDEAREYAINKAEELESKLEGGRPSFVKPMLQSHVTGGFWLVSSFFLSTCTFYFVHFHTLVIIGDDIYNICCTVDITYGN